MAEENLALQLEMLEIGDDSGLDQHRSLHGAQDQAHTPGDNCNLIVNYLPHDIDDLSLKVTALRTV
jgi:hypothetical protein